MKTEKAQNVTVQKTSAYVIGIDNNQVYRIILCKYTLSKENVAKDWNFSLHCYTEAQLIYALRRNLLPFANVELRENKLVGTQGSLDRFISKVTTVKNQPKPKTVLAEIQDEAGVKRGYILVDYNGKVAKVPLRDIANICEKVKEPDVPFSNMMVKGKDSKGNVILASYPNCSLPIEKIESAANKHTIQEKAVQNSTTVTDKFTAEQKKVLSAAKQEGVNLRYIANPELSVAQMKALIAAAKAKVPYTLFALPSYNAKVMQYLTLEAKSGIDIRKLLNPAYTLEQLTELSAGLAYGVNINSFADPKIPASEMAELCLRLRNTLWSTSQAHSSDTWKAYV